MNWNAYTILIVIALGFSIGGMVKPAWPLLPIAVLLVCIALLTHALPK